MSLKDILNDLFCQQNRLYASSLDLLQKPLQDFGNPHTAYPVIHIAGTNGKGSVATKIAKTFEFSGYQTALFTSPHLMRFSERIQINSQEIADSFMCEYIPFLLKKYPNLGFFDYTTLLGFIYFAREKVDVAVIETGLGGRYDPTNCVMPLLSIITTVSLDHTHILGNTVEDVARQKAGIIKPGVCVILGPKANHIELIKTAEEQKAMCICVPEKNLDYQSENRQIALEAIDYLQKQFIFKPQTVQQGVVCNPPCRFEKVGRFILDVAHNPEGIKSAVTMFDLHYPHQEMVVIVGLSKDKDIQECLQILSKRAAHLFLIQAPTQKSASTALMATILRMLKVTHFTECSKIEEAVILAGNTNVLVCGSFYIMQHIREKILRL